MVQKPVETAMKVIDHVDVLLGYWDSHLKCQFANAAHETWFGRSPGEMLGISMKDLLGSLYELNLPHIKGALNGEVQVFERDISLPDGSTRHSLACYFPDASDGIVKGFSVQVTDVSKIKRLEIELQTAKLKAELLATHDFLTGLPNRVLLMDRISAAISSAQKSCNLAVVVAIDLDRFKAINDTYGHECGDAVLRELAVRMRQSLRDGETITRLGGDEFIFLATGLDSVHEIQLAIIRLLDDICQPLQCDGIILDPSFSCGIAIFPTNGDSATKLLTNADRALYRAKGLGEGRFVFAS
jgi:diguanylate cyclase (GGDEF)-like protein/PAS domain S-box-containing protein